MVCEKRKESMHNFETDKIELYIENDYIKSLETNIGADNGIGVSYMLTILDSNNLKHPNLEMIFTSEEETVMGGAKNINLSNIKSKKMISLDAFSEEIINIGCASCSEKKISYNNERKIIDELDNVYKIELKGFLGGHSGNDICKKRGNPIIELTRFLQELKDVRIIEYSGGAAVNSIPRDVITIISTKDKIDNNKLVKFEENLKSIYGKNITIKCEETNKSKFAYDISDTKKIFNFILEFPNGELLTKENLNTVLSANLGKIYISDNKLNIEISIRSNLESEFIEIGNKIEGLLLKNNFKVEINDIYEGYSQSENTQFISFLIQKYKEIFLKDPIVKEEHFLLECSYFSKKITDLEYVSISPNIYNPHSPDEMVSISSIQRVWKYVRKILQEI